MTSNMNTLYNTLTNDPNAMAALSLAPAEYRADFLVRLGDHLGLPVTAQEARDFLTEA